jgi:hypothetical protein
MKNKEDKVSNAVLEALEEIDSGKVEMVTSSAEDFISQMHKELEHRKKNKMGY